MAKNKEKLAQTNESKTNAKSKSSNRGKPSAKKKTVQNKKSKNTVNSKPKKQQTQKKKNTPKREDINVKIAFLGGLNEVGKNMTLYECQDDMILVDCGLAFPEPDMLGVDLVIPDFSYLEKNAEDYEGLILLGSYSTADLSQSRLEVLSIFGSEDQVMNREKYEENKVNLPEGFTEIIIDGGCHAYFGMYGPQDGDGTPTISNEDQIYMTAEHIATTVN